MRLEGKTVLITGGRRIGADLAIKLASRGANVAFSALTGAEALRPVVAECQRIGVQADIFIADLRDAHAAENLVEKTVAGCVDQHDQHLHADTLVHLAARGF